MILTKNYPEPIFCEKEILRYAGCKSSEKELLQLSADLQTEKSQMKLLLEECIEEVRQRLTYKVCYIELPVKITENICDFGCLTVQSQNLAKNLHGCKDVILFSATIGVEIDRLIAKYSRISPTKALLFQAIGAERIEALCDAFCADIGNLLEVASFSEQTDGQEIKERRQFSLRPRFSPGYGDLPLETQREIFQILACEKNIGLTLNDSLLMSPSKSVTAFVGIVENEDTDINQKTMKCTACNKTDCVYREL